MIMVKSPPDFQNILENYLFSLNWRLIKKRLGIKYKNINNLHISYNKIKIPEEKS